MASSRKTILIAGLGTKVSDTVKEEMDIDPSETLTLVSAEVDKARTSGFDCSVFIVEPWDPVGTLDKFRAELAKQCWDGVSVGYAVRAVKENTELFEGIVNAVLEATPGGGGTRMVFPEGREDIWRALKRVGQIQE